MRKWLLFCLLSLLSVSASAQTIGEWICYPAYGALSAVFDTGKEVYALGGSSLMSYTKADESLVQYSKLDGMSDAVIDRIAYDFENKMLVILYNNKNIDILDDGVFYNVPDLKDKVMTVDKSINGVHIQNGKAYIATAFGGLVLDLKRREVLDTYILDKKVSAFFSVYGYLYAKTPEGMMRCPLSENGYDKSNWELMGGADIKQPVVTNSALFILNQNGIAHRMNADWSVTPLFGGNQVAALKADRQTVYGICPDGAYTHDIATNQWDRIADLGSIQDISSSRKEELWVSQPDGLCQFILKSGEWVLADEKIAPNAPWVVDAYDMKVAHGNLYMVTGGPFRIFGQTPGKIAILQNGDWTNIDKDHFEPGFQDFMQLNDIAVSPFDPDHFMVGSFTRGVWEFKEGKFHQRIINTNGELESADNSYLHVWASALNTDNQGNLWVVNSKVNHPLRVRTADGKWYKYNVGKLNKVEDLYPLVITRHTRNPQKWFLSYYNTLTINVFDENGTFDNTADDRSVTITSLTDQDGNTYKEAFFRCLAEDADGRMWLGTSIGPMIISNTENIFTSSGNCTRVKIPRNDGTGLADYLLDNVPVSAITIDAANRKWIGTAGNGIYLLSADGMEVIHHFTAENSPLPSNQVLSMALDSKTGKVYIGCLGGLVVYQSDAVDGNEDYSNVYAYPNPVRPDYQGVITVTGLIDNTLVKITDINNNLIYQSLSLGGQFTWDGLNKKGEKVKSGVYMVYGSAEDGKKGMVTKILFVR